MSEGLTSRQAYVALGAFAVSLILLVGVLPYAGGYVDYRMTMWNILKMHWFSSEFTTWQYGIMVPPVVAWLVWSKRAALAQLPAPGSWWGLGLMTVALLIYYAGYRAVNYYLGFFSVQLFTAGVILWTLGVRQMRVLVFPWLVMGTMWPLVFLEDLLGFPLRMISHQGVAAVLELLRAPVTAEGSTFISASPGEAPGSWMTLQVEGKCSGMNTLFALMFAALLYGYFTQKRFWPRVLVLALSIPLAILGNMVRIGLLIAGCAVLGQDTAVGDVEVETTTFHFFAGLAVFVVAFLGLQSVPSLLRTGKGRKEQPLFKTHTVAMPTSPSKAR
jgi:exosortase